MWKIAQAKACHIAILIIIGTNSWFCAAQISNAARLPALVQLGEQPNDGPTWEFANAPLQYRWTDVPGGSAGGNYLDAAGKRNGPDYHASVALSGYRSRSGEADVVVTQLVRKLLRQNTGIYIHLAKGASSAKISPRDSENPPTLTITTSTDTFVLNPSVNCWVSRTDGRTLGIPPTNTAFMLPVFMKFDLSKITGSVEKASLKVHFSWIYDTNALVAFDYLDMPPLITDPAIQMDRSLFEGGIAAKVTKDSDLASHPAVLWYPRMNSEPSILADWSYISRPDGRISINPKFVDWTEFGLKALRLESASPYSNAKFRSSILTWREYITESTKKVAGVKTVGKQSYTELYVRYMIKLDPDVLVGMSEVAVKLPGFEGSGFSARMAHLKPSLVNNAVRFAFNWYGADRPFNDRRRGELRTIDVSLRPGKIYSIEQRIKLNTILPDVVGKSVDGPIYATLPDGAVEIWVDGFKVFSRTNYVVNNLNPASAINNFFANFYHGGTGTPKAPLHYEFSGVALSRQYIGPAKKVAVPKLQQGMPQATR